jgi:hypothetical protein
MNHPLKVCSVLLTVIAMLVLVAGPAHAQQQKPNILVFWGDDIGTWNISFNNRGMMGYKTPNIDRIANETSPSLTITASKAALRAARLSLAETCPSTPA